MQMLNEIVDYYLRHDTNYALMITGEWGVGKTYFYKNILKKQISDTSISPHSKKKYKPIYVSLFGLKSVEEIQTAIFLELYPFLKKKEIKLGGTLLKSLIKGITSISNIGDVIDFKEIESNKAGWINFDQLVLCFDDLERISKNLGIDEFIGYVNSLVEHENAKILIITNETAILDDKYKKIKEKVISNTIEFKQDFSQVFDNLIVQQYSHPATFKSHLIQNKAFILDFFKDNSLNLRILMYALSYYNTIYTGISDSISSVPALQKAEDIIYNSILRFALAISIEYKNAKISYNKTEGLDNMGIFILEKILLKDMDGRKDFNKDKGEKSYKEYFIDKYYNNERYHYYRSVYEFLTGGSIFKPDELIIELKSQYHIEDNVISPHYEIFNRLDYSNVLKIDDEEYNSLTKEVLNLADNGAYKLDHYLNIFFYVVRFGNPLNYDKDKLTKRILRGIKKAKSHSTYNHNLRLELDLETNPEYKFQLLQIRDAIKDANDELHYEILKKDYKRLEEKCHNDFEEFYSEVMVGNTLYRSTPFLQYFNSKKFYQLFMKSNNYLRMRMVNFLKDRFDRYLDQLDDEYEFINYLHQKIQEKKIGMTEKGIAFFVIDQFEKTLSELLKKLKPE